MTETHATLNAGVQAGREHEIDWRGAAGDVVWIPAEFRESTMSAPAARRALRCTQASFDQLVDLGLPSVDAQGGPLFDATDVKNAGLWSRSGVTEIELTMRLMLSFMNAGRDELTRPRRWNYRLQLVSGVEPGARVVRRVYAPQPEIWGGVLESHEVPVGRPPQTGGPHFRVVQGSEVDGTLTTRGSERSVRSPAIRGIVTELLESGIRWQALPVAFSADPLRAASLGVGNCATLCAVLAHRLVEAGFEASAYHGWMIAISDVDHGWVDVVDEDGETKVLDPSFALLATGNGFGPPDFADFVTGSTLNRVVPTAAPLAQPFVVAEDGNDDESDAVVFTCRPAERPKAGMLRSYVERARRPRG